MKTKRGVIAVVTVVFMAALFFSATANAATVNTATTKHKVVLKNLTFDSVDPSAKTITAHSGSTTYTIDVSKARLRRASGEKFLLSGFLELYPDDSLTVWGKTTDETNINASKVKNNSTRKIKGLYLGTIFDITPAGIPGPGDIQGSFVMIKKDNQISVVLTYGYTKFRFEKHKTTYADLKEGDVVTIQGIIRSFDGPDGFELVYNTTQVKVRRHGTVPPGLFPTAFKFNR